jgi:hypothetical protein
LSGILTVSSLGLSHTASDVAGKRQTMGVIIAKIIEFIVTDLMNLGQLFVFYSDRFLDNAIPLGSQAANSAAGWLSQLFWF